MLDLPLERYIELYKCVENTASILEFSTHEKIFYCGGRAKFSIPNTLLIIIEEDLNNRFFEEMSTFGGATGSSYWGHPPFGQLWDPKYRHMHFHYKVITDRVYEIFKNDWSILADYSWAQTNNPYMPGLDITEHIGRIYKLKAFL